MRIRSSLLGVALVMVVAATASADRPKVAILGVEVVGDGIDVESIKVGNNLTNALRVRPNASPNPYQIAPNSNKELADEKVIKNCSSEEPSCMSAIGNDLGADVLIFGKLEKSTQNNVKGYSAHLVILNVGKKSVERTWKDFIPTSETGPDDIQKWAKSAYGKLAGGSGGGGGGLTIKVDNNDVDKGTVFIDGKVSDKLSGGKATITGVADGKHHVVVEVGGYKKYEEDITVTASDTKPHVITLEVDNNIKTCDPKIDSTCEQGGTVSQGSGKGWKTAAIVGTIVTVAAAGTAAFAGTEILLVHGGGDNCNAGMPQANDLGCTSGKTFDRMNKILWPVAGVAAVFTAYAWYRVSKAKSANSNEHALRITPVVAPSVAGANLSFDW